MAIDNSTAITSRKWGKLRVAKWLISLIAIFSIMYFAANFSHLKAEAEIGAGYGARLVCSCQYIDGRSFESCSQDIKSTTRMVRISSDPDTRQVHTSVPFLASRTAQFREGWGCILLNDPERTAE